MESFYIGICVGYCARIMTLKVLKWPLTSCNVCYLSSTFEINQTHLLDRCTFLSLGSHEKSLHRRADVEIRKSRDQQGTQTRYSLL